MEKKLRLGFVGSRVRMALIREIIPAVFPEIEPEIYADDRYDYCPEMEQYLIAMKERVDGVIFGGELQFKLYQEIFEPEVPCTCIQKDSVSLLNSFLALTWQNVDISRVSIDNYTISTVRKVFSDAGFTENHVRILRRRNWTVGEKYYEELYQEHRKLYEAGIVRRVHHHIDFCSRPSDCGWNSGNLFQTNYRQYHKDCGTHQKGMYGSDPHGRK